MALIGVLKSLNFDHLQGKDKSDLKKRLQDHKKELEKATQLVDRHLRSLGTKKKRKTGKKKA
jgi:type II secretory pathway component PulJ